MGNYHSRDWSFLRFSDCWRENHGLSVCARVYISQFRWVRGLWDCGHCGAYQTEVLRSICRGSWIVRRVDLKSFTTLLFLQELAFIPLFYIVDALTLVTGPAHHISGCVWFLLLACNCKGPLINSESTCRVSIFTPPLMRAAWRCRGWWGPGSSVSPGGMKRVIMGEEVCTDKLKEKG